MHPVPALPSPRRGACVRPRPAALLAITTVVLLAACGGGGGGDGGGTPTPAPTPVEQALARGDAGTVEAASFNAAARSLIAERQQAAAALRQQWFAPGAGAPAGTLLEGIDWNPTHDTVSFTTEDEGRSQPVLRSNWGWRNSQAGSGAVLAVAGHDPVLGARHVAFGGNPMGVPGNAAMDQLTANALQWLLTPRGNPAAPKIVTAHLPGRATYWWPHEAKVRAWLAARYPQATINGLTATAASAGNATDDTCDGTALEACLQGADLLVIGRQQGTEQTGDTFPTGVDAALIAGVVDRAQARGIPVLYLHHYRDENALAAALLARFRLGVSNNYWQIEGLKAHGGSMQPEADPALAALDGLLARLDAGSFSTTWSGCVTSVGKTGCDGDTAFVGEFLTPARALRDRLRALDADAVPLFSEGGRRLEKLAVLMGDRYRAAVSYPMTKETAGAAFFRALFADHAAYLNRTRNVSPTTLGNFAAPIDPAIATTAQATTVTPAAGMRVEHMTGWYAVPGRTITVRRTDAGTASVRLGVNLLRETTRVYDRYTRPSGLASPRVALAPGATLTLTSPYGGPVYLFVEASADATPVAVQVEGALPHPVLRDAGDPAQVEAFRAAIAATPTSWVGLATPALTVHSHIDKFRQTLTNYGNDLPKLADHIRRFMVKDTYELAGFNAADGSLTLAPEAAALCARFGWDCTGTRHRRDVMQHVIADHHAACGSGCSGNPYDQDWALDPLGWGESHEIGHNLQRGRLNILGGQSTEVSNNLFPIRKMIRANAEGARATPLRRGGAHTAAMFTLLRDAQATTDPTATVRAAIWTDTAYAANAGQRLVFYRQLVEYARHYNGAALGDGWALWTAAYLMEREFSGASGAWATRAADLGMSTYAAYPSAIDGVDFLLIATSRFIGRDMGPVFALWGLTPSAAATAQVAAYGLPAAERLLFPMADVVASVAQVGAPVAVQAGAVYPAGY